MDELTKQQYLETMVEKMKRFKLTKKTNVNKILEIAADVLNDKGLEYPSLVLSYCYENGNGTFSHYLVNWGMAKKYIVILANEISREWYGFHMLDVEKEYGLKDVT